MKKYKIELNEKQLLVIEHACELLTRIGLLQYEQIFETIHMIEDGLKYNHRFKDKIVSDMRSYMTNVDPIYRTSLNASRGIGSPDTPEDSKIACDMYQTFRYCRSWANAEHEPSDRNKYFSEYMTVNYDTPMKFGSENLPKIEEIKTKK